MHLKPLLLAGLLASVAAIADEKGDDKPEWDVNAPPAPSREAALDVTEGTWMSLDVSPDGRMIAFDLLGDIYTLPMEGGDATPIATGLAWDVQPRFSPDGSRIAFTSDRGGGDNIWTINTDGSDATQLTDEDFRLLNNPTWHPSGRFIAARKHFTTTRSMGTGEIWLYHIDGGKGVALVEKPDDKHQKELGEPKFSPDGRYLYYSLDSTPGAVFKYAQDSNKQVFEIRRYDMETGEIMSAVKGPGGAVRPEPSPDGSKLAFVRRERDRSVLFVKDLKSGALTPLYRDLDKDMQEVWAVFGVYPNMDWTPDSKHIVFWAGGGIRKLNVATGAVVDVPFRIRGSRTVLEVPVREVDVAPATFATRMPRFAAVSPDGREVVFESLGKLYIKRLPNGEPQRLTRDRSDLFELYPAWSRDGRSIVYVTWGDAELGAIHRVRASGGRSQQVTSDPGHYVRPAFSPDGSTIVFQRVAGGRLTAPEWSGEPGIYRIATRGGEMTKIVADGSRPHFADSGERLYFNRGGNTEGGASLHSIDLDGHEERKHLSGDMVKSYTVSGDGKHVSIAENYQVYVAALPLGAAEVELDRSSENFKVVEASGDGGSWPHWSADGRTLNWSLGPDLFSVNTSALSDDDYEPPAPAASLSMDVTADVPSGAVALVGAKLVTMAGPDGGVVDDGVIVIDGNRITAVGPRTSTAIPPKAEVVDVAGRTIIPGLIDAHAHGPQGTNGIIPQQNWHAQGTLAFGVTTIIDPSNTSSEIFGAGEMQRAGVIVAPRIYSTGRIVYGAKYPGYYAVIDSLEDAGEHVRRLAAQGAIAVKNYNQPRREQRQQVTHAARQEGIFVVPEGGALYHMDMSLIADGNNTIEHNIPQNVLYEDVLQFWSQTDTGYTPTLNVTYSGISGEDYWYQAGDVWKHPLLTRYVPEHILNPRAVRRQMAPNEDYVDQFAAREARKLADRGVSVHIGAHGQREGLGSHWEMWSFERGGYTPLQAIEAATIAPARQYRLDGDLGSLEVGKLADLVIINADPLARLRDSDKVEYVMINGRLYESATLNEVATGDRVREPYYWEN